MTKLKKSSSRSYRRRFTSSSALHLVMFIRILMLEGTGLGTNYSFNCYYCSGSRQSSADRGHAAVDQSFS